MKENDILLGRFADRYKNDIDIMNWVIGKTAVPEEFNTELILLIQSFNKSQ